MGKGIKEITIGAVVRRAGGKEMLQSMGELAYDHFWKTFDHLATEAFKKGFNEIIEPDPTEVSDYLDNIQRR